METFNNHEFFYCLASTLLRRSEIGVYLLFFFFFNFRKRIAGWIEYEKAICLH